MKLHVLVQHLVLRQQFREPVQFLAGRQMAVDQQIGRFDERGFLGQLLNRDAAIPQHPLLAVDERDRAAARAGVGIAVVERDQPGLVPQFRYVNRVLVLGSNDDGQLINLAADFQFRLLAHSAFLHRIIVVFTPYLYRDSARAATVFRAEWIMKTMLVLRQNSFTTPWKVRPFSQGSARASRKTPRFSEIRPIGRVARWPRRPWCGYA